MAGSGWAAYDGGYEYAVWRDIVGRSYILAGSTTVVMGKKTIDCKTKSKSKKEEWVQWVGDRSGEGSSLYRSKEGG